MEKILTKLETVENIIISNTNALTQALIDSDYLNWKIYKTKAKNGDLLTRLGALQAQIRHHQDVIGFMEEKKAELIKEESANAGTTV